MKRTPIKRRTRLERNAPIRARGDTKYRRRERDMDYMGWVREQACAAIGFGGCDGPIEADHAGLRGVGQKAADNTCIPLCRRHHRQRGSFSGTFRLWTKDKMRRWLERESGLYQILYRGSP